MRLIVEATDVTIDVTVRLDGDIGYTVNIDLYEYVNDHWVRSDNYMDYGDGSVSCEFDDSSVSPNTLYRINCETLSDTMEYWSDYQEITTDSLRPKFSWVGNPMANGRTITCSIKVTDLSAGDRIANARLMWSGPNGDTTAHQGPDHGDTGADFTFTTSVTVPEDGTYKLWWRTWYSPNTQGNLNKKSIDVEGVDGTVWIYNNGWKKAVPWIYNNGWKQAKPWIYNNGWKETI